MKGSIRVSAKTLDDAITEALIQLGVTSDRLEYEVIEKGSAGFLGIGMKQAVIEAWKKEEEPEVTVEDIIKEEFRTEKKPEAPKKKEKPARVKEEAKAEPAAEVKKETAAEPAEAKEEPEEAETQLWLAVDLELTDITVNMFWVNPTLMRPILRKKCRSESSPIPFILLIKNWCANS